MSISLIIKGNKRQAKKAADNHGVAITVLREVFHTRERVETVALTVNEYGPLVGRWFNESDRAPFPVGTLLLFTHID